ncbi:Prolyl oligopeptidase family protein [Amycolatopsis pretoriensis]|uniref:Prolyl oligopeptidase family protein n=1 Tax=Amycolatopsis pretoriensis TaxID=218821 RepID=A0A1H5QDT2_9PSEU|nr:alpha/beta hydrolase [Amycolatopsis pretoriensis]SEF24014.1 Prolyl oligopeptidase family protein [Amycolatopsis pretoriensis]
MIYREVPGFRPLELELSGPDDPVATIVYLHGGGWRRGSRLHSLPGFEHLTDELVAHGFRVAAADYRLSGEATFPAPLDDVRAAIESVRDGKPVFVWGESAGAHLGLLAALTGSTVDAVVAWFPPTDLLGLTGDVSRETSLLGAPPDSVPDLARAASPVTHAHAGAPPVLLMHGSDDDLVPASQSVRLAGALRDAGAPVELHLVPGARHRWIGADPAAVVATSVKFLRAALTR